MTEKISQRFTDFDQWSTRDAIEAMYEGQFMALSAIRPALEDIARAADAAAKRLGSRGRLVYVGAGTSGRLAVQDGVELGPTFSWPQDRIVVCIAGGLKALTVSAEGAEDISGDGAKQIQQAKTDKNDVVIGVAASGTTPFTFGALKEANARGALTIGIANNPDTPILKEAYHSLLANTGSEPIAGSTRMKAGTAQKIILNMLSTAIMTRLGRVYKGYMIDMKASNNKLEARAIHMVSEISKCSETVAEQSLGAANFDIKTAVLIARGESLAKSRETLETTGRNLRQALAILNVNNA